MTRLPRVRRNKPDPSDHSMTHYLDDVAVWCPTQRASACRGWKHLEIALHKFSKDISQCRTERKFMNLFDDSHRQLPCRANLLKHINNSPLVPLLFICCAWRRTFLREHWMRKIIWDFVVDSRLCSWSIQTFSNPLIFFLLQNVANETVIKMTNQRIKVSFTIQFTIIFLFASVAALTLFAS